MQGKPTLVPSDVLAFPSHRDCQMAWGAQQSAPGHAKWLLQPLTSRLQLVAEGCSPASSFGPVIQRLLVAFTHPFILLVADIQVRDVVLGGA
jgi:hypothetical protein